MHPSTATENPNPTVIPVCLHATAIKPLDNYGYTPFPGEVTGLASIFEKTLKVGPTYVLQVHSILNMLRKDINCIRKHSRGNLATKEEEERYEAIIKKNYLQNSTDHDLERFKIEQIKTVFNSIKLAKTKTLSPTIKLLDNVLESNVGNLNDPGLNVIYYDVVKPNLAPLSNTSSKTNKSDSLIEVESIIDAELPIFEPPLAELGTASRSTFETKSTDVDYPAPSQRRARTTITALSTTPVAAPTTSRTRPVAAPTTSRTRPVAAPTTSNAKQRRTSEASNPKGRRVTTDSDDEIDSTTSTVATAPTTNDANTTSHPQGRYGIVDSDSDNESVTKTATEASALEEIDITNSASPSSTHSGALTLNLILQMHYRKLIVSKAYTYSDCIKDIIAIKYQIQKRNINAEVLVPTFKDIPGISLKSIDLIQLLKFFDGLSVAFKPNTTELENRYKSFSNYSHTECSQDEKIIAKVITGKELSKEANDRFRKIKEVTGVEDPILLYGFLYDLTRPEKSTKRSL